MAYFFMYTAACCSNTRENGVQRLVELSNSPAAATWWRPLVALQNFLLSHSE